MPTISFTTGRALRQGREVRKLMAFSLLALSVALARAQEQERRLIDRLLRPDMTLANGAQDKRFVAEKTAIDKMAAVTSFYVAERPLAKQFPADREFAARRFAARDFRAEKISATVRTRPGLAKPAVLDSGRGTFSIRDASESGRKVASRNFAGNRPFLGQGKSQKALSQRDTPLTIEQVRELLNKNK